MHTPTRETRRTVHALSSYGIPQPEICLVLGVSDKTLRKHYREELDTAATKANAKVAEMLYKNCMSGKEASIFFWLKTRPKWREKTDLDLTSNGEKITGIAVIGVDAPPEKSKKTPKKKSKTKKAK